MTHAIETSLVSLWGNKYSTNPKHFVCGGVFVGKARILTAKHAFYGRTPAKIWIRPYADATQTYPILGEVYLCADLDVALIHIESMPSGAMALKIDHINDSNSGAYTLHGYFEGRVECRQKLTALSFNPHDRVYVTSPKFPKGHSGSAVCRAGRLWGLAIAHYTDPNIDRAAVIAVHQFGDWLGRWIGSSVPQIREKEYFYSYLKQFDKSEVEGMFKDYLINTQGAQGASI